MAAPAALYISQSLEPLTPPKTPPVDAELGPFHYWPEPETEREEFHAEIPWYINTEDVEDTDDFHVPYQDVLLLHGPKQKYVHTKKHPIPRLQNDREMLVEVGVVGLNPIDWKAPYATTEMNIEGIADNHLEISDLACQIYHVSAGAILLGRYLKPPRPNRVLILVIL